MLCMIRQDGSNKKRYSHGGYNIAICHPPTPWQRVDWTRCQPLLSLAEVYLADPLVGQWWPCVKHHFQLTRSKVSMEATKRIRSIYLPCSCFNLAAYRACNFSSVCNYIKKTSLLKRKTYLSSHLSGEVSHFHLFKFNIRFAAAQQGKKTYLYKYTSWCFVVSHPLLSQSIQC